MAVDQVGNPLNATIRGTVITESGVSRLKEGQAEQRVGNQCTELEYIYNVFSQDSSAQVELYACRGSMACINLGISNNFLLFLFSCAHALLDSSQFSPRSSASVTVSQSCNKDIR